MCCKKWLFTYSLSLYFAHSLALTQSLSISFTDILLNYVSFLSLSFSYTLCPKNIHHRGKYHCMADLLFDWLWIWSKQVKLLLINMSIAAESKQNKRWFSCTMMLLLKLCSLLCPYLFSLYITHTVSQASHFEASNYKHFSLSLFCTHRQKVFPDFLSFNLN